MRTPFWRTFSVCSFILIWSHAPAGTPAPASSPAPSTPASAPAPVPPADLDSLNAPLQPEAKFAPLVPVAGQAEAAVNNQYLQEEAAADTQAEKKKNDQSVAAKDAEALEEKHDKETNWLLHNYEEQMRARSPDDPAAAGGTDLFNTIASNKDLAKLAGLKPLTDDDKSKSPSPKADDNGTGKPTLKLRPDADLAADKKNNPHSANFLPLITPLSAPEAAGLHDFYSSLPAADATDTTAGGPSKLDTLVVSAGATGTDGDASTVDVPGLTAAQGTGAADLKAQDSGMSIDMLPGESLGDAMKHQDTFTYSDAPATTAVTQLQNQEISQMALPVSVGHAPALPMSPLLTNPALDAKPVTMSPAAFNQPRVADPFDMLNR